MTARALMIMGTGSHVGKSLLVAGLARAFTRRGLAVRPFKPQNMSNNAAVAQDGGEIGRAQALQARACLVPPSHHMNPVLLKPEAESRSQVIVQGRRLTTTAARDYYRLKPELMPFVLESFETLSGQADLVLCEGAGSPAEVNLRAGDIANTGFALARQIPAILAGDIERGGVIAQLVGTVALLEPAERALFKGTIVNKFRGDPRLFDSAIPVIEARTHMPVLGVIPWFADATRLPPEDSLALDDHRSTPPNATATATIRVAVPHLPRLSNLDDLDPLHHEPAVALTLLEPGTALPADTDLVLLPGSKATIADLAFLRAQGWDIDIHAHARRGGWILGLCGGFQMLGHTITDPHGTEGPKGDTAQGLGLLDVTTELAPAKTTRTSTGHDLATGTPVTGYEIHTGHTTGPASPMLSLDNRPDGALHPSGRIMGCYLHGLLANDACRRTLLTRMGARRLADEAFEDTIETTLDSLAHHLETHLDLDTLLAMAAMPRTG